ncbi:hypothetical protein [Bacillus sp. 166amftsu]|uniref:hypothetical protein n=1 Tax=Bacillus sp. 166amftsu TaxID=1761753 RepID=UPI0008996F21|nr:hypothetical protein [Bacillus sp. 166amftsu]SDY72206.1 hypothetical protein SAMN04488156_10255 [Bacillus sp. 166amftsu]
MKQVNLNMILLFIQLFALVTNLSICSTSMPFFPWFIEKGFGWFGIFITTPVLLIIGTIMTYHDKKKRYSIKQMRQSVPFITVIFFMCVSLLPLTDRIVITSFIVNLGLVIITIVFLSQDISKRYTNREYRLKRMRIRQNRSDVKIK